jgi:S1-C subfamily serine protease
MTGSYGVIPLPFRPILPKLSKTLWNSEMQRGILGVEGGELNAKASRELGITRTEGFYISTVTKIRCPKVRTSKGDIIIKLDNQSIATFADFLGTSIQKTKRQSTSHFVRDGNNRTVPVVLQNFFQYRIKGIELRISMDKRSLTLITA